MWTFPLLFMRFSYNYYECTLHIFIIHTTKNGPKINYLIQIMCHLIIIQYIRITYNTLTLNRLFLFCFFFLRYFAIVFVFVFIPSIRYRTITVHWVMASASQCDKRNKQQNNRSTLHRLMKYAIDWEFYYYFFCPLFFFFKLNGKYKLPNRMPIKFCFDPFYLSFNRPNIWFLMIISC